jgi:type IV pilus assembly protein PilM
MAFFKSIFGEKRLLGVDIGTTSIKVAEIGEEKDGLKLLNYGMLETFGYLERFNEALQSSILKLSEDTTAKYLKLLLEKSHIQTINAIASLPAFMAFSTLIEVPQMSDTDVKKFIEFQAKQYIPLPLETVAFEWIKVGERTEGFETKDQLLLISIPNEHIQRYGKIFENAGLKLEAIELEGVSLARVLSRDIKEPVLILDVGSRSTSLSIAKSSLLKFSGQTDFAGGTLTQTIAKGLSINQRRAEDLKKQRGLVGNEAGRELSTLIEPQLDVILNEGKRFIQNFEGNYREKVMRVILSGGGANLLGITEYAVKHFDLPVTKANPFAHIGFTISHEALKRDIGPQLAVAIGLGAKDFL